jgi:hypothetical protein
MSAAWKYEFKINYSCGVAQEKWAKIFLSMLKVLIVETFFREFVRNVSGM